MVLIFCFVIIILKIRENKIPRSLNMIKNIRRKLWLIYVRIYTNKNHIYVRYFISIFFFCFYFLRYVFSECHLRIWRLLYVGWNVENFFPGSQFCSFATARYVYCSQWDVFHILLLAHHVRLADISKTCGSAVFKLMTIPFWLTFHGRQQRRSDTTVRRTTHTNSLPF